MKCLRRSAGRKVGSCESSVGPSELCHCHVPSQKVAVEFAKARSYSNRCRVTGFLKLVFGALTLQHFDPLQH